MLVLACMTPSECIFSPAGLFQAAISICLQQKVAESPFLSSNSGSSDVCSRGRGGLSMHVCISNAIPLSINAWVYLSPQCQLGHVTCILSSFMARISNRCCSLANFTSTTKQLFIFSLPTQDRETMARDISLPQPSKEGRFRR